LNDQKEGTLLQVIETKKTVVTLGPGGVGKTTISAALAIGAARTGRKVVVVTVDPAKRLASALGLESLSNTPTNIELPPGSKGTLHALMLDVQETFENMVKTYSSSQEQIDEIFANKIYQNLTQSLSGTQEYMAMERLWELHQDESFDLVVVDTPPSVGALDLLEAPKRLVSFLDNRVFQLLIKPVPLYLRPLSIATRTLLKTISKVVGSEVVTDAVEFFRAFSGIEEGFKARALEIGEILASENTCFIGVTSPQSLALKETVELNRRLIEGRLSLSALIVNRLTPQFTQESNLQKDNDLSATLQGSSDALAVLEENFKALQRSRKDEVSRVEKRLVDLFQVPFIFIDNQQEEVSTAAALDRLGRKILS
jgi:anion-transporting  ArsA/GET3 family ATPase